MGAGFGGMGLHSIAIDADDPKKMQVGISVGGVYTSTDGGATWVQDNAQTGGKEDRPDVFDCIHKLLAHPKTSGVRFMRVHVDVFWREPGRDDVAEPHRGPSVDVRLRRGDASARASDRVLRSRSTTPSGPRRCRDRVYKTNDRGATWKRNDKGLPPGARLESVREGMDTDLLDPLGVYFGTANGDVWASRDEGTSWEAARAQYLPYVTSVHAATIE